MNSVLLQIPNLFMDNSEDSILTIKKENDEYLLSVSNEFDPIRSKLTCNYFKEIVGTQRFKQICRKPYIALESEDIDQNSIIITKNFARKFFVGLFDLHKEDLDKTKASKAIDENIRDLIIFKESDNIESLFMKDRPLLQEFDNAKTSGKGFEGLIERVYIRILHHFMSIKEGDKKIAKLCDIEMLTSRLADREMQKGEIVLLSNGYFYVDQVIIGGGAYISILKDIEGIKPPKIICRGTAMRRTATEGLKSGVNDLLLEVGMMGIKKIWPPLSQYLKENKISSVEILGKSLGGAYAQELAILIEGILGIEIKQLITFCSVGVGEAINNLFKKEILHKRKTTFNILVLRNGGSIDQIDYIPVVGGVHLGEGTASTECKIKICYIQPGNGEVNYLSDYSKWHKLFRRFLASFRGGHSRQTTLKEFNYKIVDDSQINAHLRMGNQLEKVRKSFAYTLHTLTLRHLNSHSFNSYFYLQR